MTVSNSPTTPPAFQRSRAKIWLRTGILALFGTLFGIAIYGDLISGAFPWYLALLVFVPSLGIGFWMRRWVPMQVHTVSQHITFSFDRTYFVVILLLVIAKLITGRVPGLLIWTDALMCAILGLMSGRLSGICLRVRALKIRHGFLISHGKK